MHVRKYGHTKGRTGYRETPCCLIGSLCAVSYDYWSNTIAIGAIARVVDGDASLFSNSARVKRWNDRPETTAGAAFNALWAAAKLARSEGK